MNRSRAATTCGMSKISSVKPVSAPSASAIIRTGMLMPMIETAAWIASSMMVRLRSMCSPRADAVDDGRDADGHVRRDGRRLTFPFRDAAIAEAYNPNMRSRSWRE